MPAWQHFYSIINHMHMNTIACKVVTELDHLISLLPRLSPYPYFDCLEYCKLLKTDSKKARERGYSISTNTCWHCYCVLNFSQWIHLNVLSDNTLYIHTYMVGFDTGETIVIIIIIEDSSSTAIIYVINIQS